ncbi:hypothetical protein V6B08_18615 [Ferrovibrio sp. MS7]|jgi:hypothetical protein|uniref:hypothetical protein n=1 Tax=Ferrovibrio TaxID=1231242 RepID=UPI001B67B2AC|nr:hypothetical protein [Ferrovibrio sp.]
MLRLFAPALLALIFGLGGGYAGAQFAKHEIEREQEARFMQHETHMNELARRSMTLISGLTSLAVDSEITAADVAELRNRMDRVEVMRQRR